VSACPNVRRPDLGARWSARCACESCARLRAEVYARRSAQWAARWTGALDEIAVERALGGDRPAVLAAADRLEVVRIATAHGESAAQIARRLRVSARTVVRYRGRLAA
jgi:DNA-binding NarL/FixJ family response regulator